MLQTYIDWLGNALPVWDERGFDRDAGRFHERLDLTGAPVAVPQRAMVQARQIYVYAHAAVLGLYPPGAALAERAMASLIRDFCEEHDGRASFAFSIDRGGCVVSDVRDAYAHAFVLFALAWLYRLNGDPKLLALADKTLAYIDVALADPVHGGLYDAVPITDRSKRQNPLMHLLEACLFLEQAAPERGYIDRAAELVALFRQRLFKVHAGVLLEYFSEDWGAHTDPAKASMFEPGHHMEWVWLLGEYNRLSGDGRSDEAAALFATSTAHGLTPTGLLYDEVALDLSPRKRAHRVWPHSEAIKAAVVRRDRALADRMAGALLNTFLDRPFAGGWIDHVDERGIPLVDYVPASTLYHLFLAGAEAATGFAIAPTIAKPTASTG